MWDSKPTTIKTLIVQGAGFEDLRRQSAHDLVTDLRLFYRWTSWLESLNEMNAVLDHNAKAARKTNSLSHGVGAPDS